MQSNTGAKFPCLGLERSHGRSNVRSQLEWRNTFACVLLGRSGLRPSLVRGDSPRNAPLTPLHPPPAVGSNAALRNRRSFAPPPWVCNSSVSPTRRVPTRPCVRVASRSRVRPESTAPCGSWPLATGNCSLDGRACGPPLCGGTPPATPPLMYAPRRVWGHCSLVLPAAQRAAPNSANAAAAEGAGPVPALRLSHKPENHFSAAGLNSPPGDSRPKKWNAPDSRRPLPKNHRGAGRFVKPGWRVWQPAPLTSADLFVTMHPCRHRAPRRLL